MLQLEVLSKLYCAMLKNKGEVKRVFRDSHNYVMVKVQTSPLGGCFENWDAATEWIFKFAPVPGFAEVTNKAMPPEVLFEWQRKQQYGSSI